MTPHTAIWIEESPEGFAVCRQHVTGEPQETGRFLHVDSAYQKAQASARWIGHGTERIGDLPEWAKASAGHNRRGFLVDDPYAAAQEASEAALAR